MAHGRLFSSVAIGLAAVMGIVPLEPMVAAGVQLFSASQRSVDIADDVDVLGEAPLELTGDVVERLVPESASQVLPSVEVPTGDYSLQLAEAEAVIPTVELPEEPPAFEEIDFAAETEHLSIVDRTEFENIFDRGDGSLLSVSSPSPINVEVDGQWVESETSVQRDAEKLVARTHPLSPEFLPGKGGPVSLERDGHSVMFWLEDGHVAGP